MPQRAIDRQELCDLSWVNWAISLQFARRWLRQTILKKEQECGCGDQI